MIAEHHYKRLPTGKSFPMKSYNREYEIVTKDRTAKFFREIISELRLA